MENDLFREERLKYEDIEVPDELLFMVRRTVAADRRKKAVRRRNQIIRAAGSVAAVLILCLGIGVNSSYSVAKTAVKIPVIKSVAKAFIVRSYKAEVIREAEEELKNSPRKHPEEIKEPEEEPVISISGNDITESEPEKSVEEPAEEPVKLQGLELWKSELTLNDLKAVTELYDSESEAQFADAPEKQKTILLAELPEKDISLYGYHENGEVKGVALRVKDRFKCFDWTYMNETKNLPELFSMDINKDGSEELLILLCNRELSMAEVSPEDIAEPETDGEEKDSRAEDGSNENTNENTKENTTEGADGDTVPAKMPAENGTTAPVKMPAEEESFTLPETEETVSGNDRMPSGDTKELHSRPGDELWVVSLTGEEWTETVFSAEDYESQILHKLKADYDEEGKYLQLYLSEEPLGLPVSLSEEEGALTYEMLKITPDSRFVFQDGISLYFTMDVIFKDENGESRILKSEFKLEADVSFDGDSFMIEQIRLREEEM